MGKQEQARVLRKVKGYRGGEGWVWKEEAGRQEGRAQCPRAQPKKSELHLADHWASSLGFEPG